MKTLINQTLLFFACLMLTTISYSQITLEHGYSGSGLTYTTKLSDGSTKFVNMSPYTLYTEDYIIKLYNLDHTLFKEIHLLIEDVCPVNNIGTFSPVRYITDKMFDSDGDLELMTYVACNDTFTSAGIGKVLVFNEDGSVLFSRENFDLTADAATQGITLSTVVNTESGTKMILRSLDGDGTEVYSLPGVLPAELEIISGVNVKMDAYPNPVQYEFSVSYDTHGISLGKISIRDMHGIEVISQVFDTENGTQNIDVSTLTSGQYTVSLEANGKTLGMKKIVVIK